VDVPKVARRNDAVQVAALVASPEIAQLTADLEATRWTGRPGYPIETMIGVALAKSIYAIPTWTRTIELLREHTGLQVATGCTEDDLPSEWACYRFARKLREHRELLDRCTERVVAVLRVENPHMGRDVAIDGSNLTAYANGQRFLSKNGPERERYSDPDASWGHRSAVSTRKGGGFYGYKIHAAVCTDTGLPLAWHVATAKDAEATYALPLLDKVRGQGFNVTTAIMDKGYDTGPIHDGCMDSGVCPVTALVNSGRVKRGLHKPPTCEHGEMTFAGADRQRRATQWHCATGDCASVWIAADRLHPLIPRESERSRMLYRKRGAVERTFAHLKTYWALDDLRVRGLDKVRLHVDLTVLARLGCALNQARTVPLAA
jgi:IS5 family transposase